MSRPAVIMRGLSARHRNATELTLRSATASRRCIALRSRTMAALAFKQISFLAVVLDVFSRRVVGWAMAPHMRAELVVDAPDMASHNRKPKNVIHHSDQGSQYISIAFSKRSGDADIRPSMGSVGDCYDNVMCESFNAILECEFLVKRRFRN